MILACHALHHSFPAQAALFCIFVSCWSTKSPANMQVRSELKCCGIIERANSLQCTTAIAAAQEDSHLPECPATCNSALFKAGESSMCQSHTICRQSYQEGFVQNAQGVNLFLSLNSQCFCPVCSLSANWHYWVCRKLNACINGIMLSVNSLLFHIVQ